MPGLKTRPPSGGIALDDGLKIARQIIDALEAAHEQGIIHRDLKPQNIKVRDDGTVKVLDFGLAKALDANASGATADAANSPTLTARATQMGMILGTAAYMSPEQARGRAVDKRMARFEVSPPGKGRFIGAAPRMAISPDGRTLAFSASSKPTEADQLWIRRLDSMEVLPVPGTQSTPDANQPQSPFWSPDSRQLAFFVMTGLESGGQESRLLTVDMTGGAVRKICDLPSNNASGT